VTEGDKIMFGAGPQGDSLNKPNPKLCQLHLAIARAMKSGGVNQAMEEAACKNDYSRLTFQKHRL
jgi:hypothetical protein